ncbi:MAG: hypothetical protein U0745_01095 [Polyangia bacterium]|jgi:hypothetical protein
MSKGMWSVFAFFVRPWALGLGLCCVAWSCASDAVLDEDAVWDALPTTVRDPAKWPFSADSPWNTPIACAATAPYSCATTWEAADGACTKQLRYRSTTGAELRVALNAEEWSHPIFIAKSTDPLSTLSQQTCYGMPALTVPNVRIPATAKAALPAFVGSGVCDYGNTDAHLHIIEPKHQFVDETWHARPSASGGFDVFGYTRNSLTGSGIGKGGERAYGGSAIAGLIRKGELSSGIKHALALAIPHSQMKCIVSGSTPSDSCDPVWPASKVDDGARAKYKGEVPMGQLVSIPVDADLSSLGLTAGGLRLAQALKDYGAYVVDASEDVVLYADPAAALELAGARKDLAAIRALLRCVTNNSETRVGGGDAAAPRRQPPALPFK